MYNDLKREEILKSAPLLAKWLGLLFILILPAVTAQLLNNNFMMMNVPFLFAAGQVLNFACFFAYGYILLQLGGVEKGYRTAGICHITAASLNMVQYLLEKNSALAPSLILTLPMVAFSVAAVYNEYHSHSSVLAGIDDNLSKKWLGLWKWYLVFLICMISANFIIMIVLILGLFTMLFAMAGTIVLNIFQLIFLYRTVSVFKKISSQNI